MKFTYKVQLKNGTYEDGIKEGDDKFAVARSLRREGMMPIAVTALSPSRHFFFERWYRGTTISLSEKIIFTNNLRGMLSAGVSLARALSVLQRQSADSALVPVLRSLVSDVDSGKTFSDALAKFPKIFSRVFVVMVKAGEESGTLPDALAEIGRTLKKTYELNKNIKSALVYPVIVLGLVFLLGILMMTFVVPTLAETFAELGASLPISTRMIIALSRMLTEHGVIIIAGVSLIVLVCNLLWRLPQVKRLGDYGMLHIPRIGFVVKNVNIARTARTLSSLLSSGVPMPEALVITADVLQNSYYKNVVLFARRSIEKGVLLSDSFTTNTDLYPGMVGEMIAVGEESGNVSKMLLDIAVFYESEVESATKDLSTALEPFLMIIIGLLVGFFTISILSPIYSLMDTIA